MMDSDKDKTGAKGKEPEINPESPLVSSEILVGDNNPQQDEPPETPSVSSESDSLVIAGNYIYIKD